MRIASFWGVVGVILILASSAINTMQVGQIPPNPKVVGPPVLQQVGKRGGQLTISIANPKTLNPFPAVLDRPDPLVTLMHAGILETNPLTGLLEPALAKSYEFSKDGQSVTIILREGLRFSDGDDFTANDVVFTYKEALDFILRGLQLQFKVMDKHTLTITAAAPIFPGIFRAIGPLPILPEHRLRGKATSGWGLGTPPDQIAGMGPYRLVSYAAGQQFVLERNPFFWKVDTNGQQLPYLDRVIAVVTPYREDELQKLQSGSIDFLVLKPEELATMQQAPGFRTIIGGLAYGFEFLALNQDVRDADLQKLFRERLFRQALAQALNRKKVLEAALKGLGKERFGPVGEASPFFDPAIARYDFNLSAAGAKLDQLGLVDTDKDGIRNLTRNKQAEFEILTNQDNRTRIITATQLKEDLQQIGIRVHLKLIPFAELNQRLTSGNFTAILAGFGSSMDLPNPVTPFDEIYRSSGRLHFWHRSASQKPFDYERRIDKLFDESFQVTDLEQLKKFISEFQQIIADQQPFIPLFSRTYIVLINAALGNSERLNANGGPLEFIIVLFRKDL